MSSVVATPQERTKAVSTVNSSTTALAGGGTFIEEFEWNDAPEVLLSCLADQDGTLYVDFSNNGTTYPSTISFVVNANVHEFHTLVKGARYARVRFVNGSAAQTSFELFTSYGHLRQGNAALNSTIRNDSDATVVRMQDELEVMLGKVSGAYIIAKYGRNSDVDAAEDIWNGGGDYTGFPTATAEEFQVLSSSVNDTAAGTGARTVRVYYMNSNYEAFDSSGNFLYFDVTLNGTTAVNSGVTGMRAWRAEVLTSGSGFTNAGDITVRWRTTTSNVFVVMPTGFAHSASTAFTIPAGYTGYLKRFSASMDDQTANAAGMAIKSRDFGSNTFQLRRPFVVSTTVQISRELFGAEKYLEKTDIVFRATSVTNPNGIITVSYGLMLVKN